MFSKNKKINSHLSTVDKIVTGVIIGGAVAGIFGLSQTKKGKEITTEVKTKFTPKINTIGKKIVSGFGKTIAFFVGIAGKK